MKDSRLMYDYIRRWWLLLLLGPAIGALAGLAYYSSQVHQTSSATVATVTFTDPTWVPDDSLPTSEFDDQGAPALTLSLNFGSRSTEEGAVKTAASSLTKMASYTNTPVVIREATIDWNATDGAWWKAVLLGTVLGTLMVTGWAYVWVDLRAYQQHSHQVGEVGT